MINEKGGNIYDTFSQFSNDDKKKMKLNAEVMRVCTTDAKHNIRQIQNSISKYTVSLRN